LLCAALDIPYVPAGAPGSASWKATEESKRKFVEELSVVLCPILRRKFRPKNCKQTVDEKDASLLKLITDLDEEIRTVRAEPAG